MNNRQSVNVDSNVIREQHASINVHEIPLESDVDSLVITLFWEGYGGRPRRKTVRIPVADIQTNDDYRPRKAL